MLELHLDPVGGIAGDMFAAAVLDLRPDLEAPLREALALCPLIADVTVSLVNYNDGVLAGRRFLVDRAAGDQPPARHAGHHRHHHAHDHHDHDHDHEHHHEDHRHHDHVDWRLIREALVTSKLDPETIRHALGIFSLLADAEARVHGVPVDDISFHEVGAWDSIADIVAAAWLVRELGASRWTVGPIPLGSGRVKSAHGLLPIPAPATTLLLEGFETIDDGIAGERVTPTGAAILRYLCDRDRKPAAPRRLVGSSHGFGTKRFPMISNCLRLLAFETGSPAFAARDTVAVLECEIDDQTGEDLAHAIDHLRSHPGVLDAVQSTVFGKKGRVMTHLRVLAEAAAEDDVAAKIFEETTTLGLRRALIERRILKREAARADSDRGPLRVKRAERPSGPSVKVEADDLAGVAGNRARNALRRQAEASLDPENDKG